MNSIDMAKIFRESFDKQTDFGHDETNTELISGDRAPGECDKAMDEVMEESIEETFEENDVEVMEKTIEETLEENDVVLDGLNNDTIEENLESFDKKTEFGHDEANAELISGDNTAGEDDKAMDEEVMENTIEENLEENDVELDGLNNDTIEETLEESNVHNDSIGMNECKYCEDAIPNKSFKAHTGNYSD